MVVSPMPHRIWPMAICHGFTAPSDGGGSAAASSYSRPSTARSVRPSSAAI